MLKSLLMHRYCLHNHPNSLGDAESALLAKQAACLENHTGEERLCIHTVALTQGKTMGSAVTQKSDLQQAAIWPRAAQLRTH